MESIYAKNITLFHQPFYLSSAQQFEENNEIFFNRFQRFLQSLLQKEKLE